MGGMSGLVVRGLEEVSIPFLMRFKNFLASLGPSRSGKTWFVHYAFRRPLPSWDQLQPVLRTYLETFRDDPRELQSAAATLHDTFEIHLFRASRPHVNSFILGATVDGDSGGFVMAETLKNLPICVEEKTRKIASVRHKYPEWWLVLIDLIGSVLDENEQELLRKHFTVKHGWDKIILVNPLDPRSAFELE